jgi:hypothetical protein
MLRRIFGPKKGKLRGGGEKYIKRSFSYTLYQSLIG